MAACLNIQIVRCFAEMWLYIGFFPIVEVEVCGCKYVVHKTREVVACSGHMPRIKPWPVGLQTSTGLQEVRRIFHARRTNGKKHKVS